MHILYLLLICVIVFLAYTSVHGANGVRKFTEVNAELEQAKETTRYLSERNSMMKGDIEALRNNENFVTVENLARSNLGMIKPGEVFYRVILPENEGKNR